ncbi:hypothetical protein ACFZBU_06680 [Embleya sp. NPDC008237]|uniref:hypothetical protein n=1 Tax=Embleya sp. NPDC008237 TaxID=3363978 RepID=UPI0036ECCFB8
MPGHGRRGGSGLAGYRRKPTPSDAHADPDERLRAHENTNALLGLLRVHPVLWVDDLWVDNPTAVDAAEHKPTQPASAGRAGLHVPDTLLTCDPPASRAFVDAHHGNAVLKTPTQPAPRSSPRHGCAPAPTWTRSAVAVTLYYLHGAEGREFALVGLPSRIDGIVSNDQEGLTPSLRRGMSYLLRRGHPFE